VGTPLNDARTERGGVIAGHPSHHAKLIENITMTAAIAVAFIWRLPRGTMTPSPAPPQRECASRTRATRNPMCLPRRLPSRTASQ